MISSSPPAYRISLESSVDPFIKNLVQRYKITYVFISSEILVYGIRHLAQQMVVQHVAPGRQCSANHQPKLELVILVKFF